MKKNLRFIVLALAAVIFLVGLDQYTKALAVRYLSEGTPFVIWNGVFELRYTVNQGAAFGILQNRQALFIVLTLAVLLGVFWLFLFRIPAESKYLPLNVLCVTITAGAVGNFIDRVMMGYVVDFLYIRLIDFPIFNVADCYVTFSVAIFFLLVIFRYKEEDLKGIL